MDSTMRWQFKRILEPVGAKPYHYVMCGIVALARALYTTSYARYLQNITKALEDGDKQTFLFRIVVLCVTAALFFAMKFLDRKYFFGAVTDTDVYVYKKYMSIFFFADNTKIEKIGTGRIISILKAWTNNRSFTLAEIFWKHLNVIFTIVISLIFIAAQSVRFFVATLVVLMVVFIRIKIFGPKAAMRRSKTKEISIETDRNVVRQVMSKFEILQSNKYVSEIQKYITLAREGLKYRYKEKYMQTISYDGSVFLVHILRALVIAGVWYAVFSSSSSISDFVLVTTLTWVLSNTIGELSTIGKSMADNIIHIEKLWKVFDEFTEEKALDEGDEFVCKTWDIKFEHVSFAYQWWNKVLSDFSLHIEGKKKTALVGISWWGKTTLIKLASLYIKPDSGAVYVDGQNLRDLRLSSYYAHIGYLTQEPSVFDGTIYDNLTYALNHVPDPHTVEKAIQDAQCEFIYEFENGLQTEIWERWIRLSGGQRQRLAIAKIMLKNPQIIFLDEPTSALDSFNEEKVSIALQRLFENKTVVIVAHRLQTVKSADRIILLEDGKILEEWTHEELIALWWNYKKMLDLQSGF